MKAPLRDALTRLGIHSLYRLARNSALRDVGWFRSYRDGAAVDGDGNPIPWMSYPAIELLAERVRPDMRVFEYGSGNSTLWWAGRVAEIVACEHDAEWYERVRATLPPNAQVIKAPLDYDGEYCRTITRFPARFDVVVIDGRDRVGCARQAPAGLKPEGVIVWDNTNRERYEAGFAYLAEAGFRRLKLRGMAPILPTPAETSIFYRPGNCLGI